jgi:hypothetical protein
MTIDVKLIASSKGLNQVQEDIFQNSIDTGWPYATEDSQVLSALNAYNAADYANEMLQEQALIQQFDDVV